MNTVAITVKVINGKGEEFLQTIRLLQERLKTEEGFSKCTVYQDVPDENAFNLMEEWKTQDYLENHLKADSFRVLIGALKVLSAESEVRYHLTSQQGVTKSLKSPG